MNFFDARRSGTSPAAALNAMRLPAITLDQDGFVAEVNAAAEAVFDNDFRIKDGVFSFATPTPERA